MTVSSQVCKRMYQADGENRQWAVDFPYLSASELKVYVTNSAGVETEVTSQCVLDEIEHEVIYPTEQSAQSPLPVGNVVTLLRVTSPTQMLHLTQQGTLDASSLEQGLDKLTLQVQELAEQSRRSIKYPVSSNQTDVDAQTLLSNLQNTQAALNGKQDVLTTSQQAAVDSGVTSSTVSQVATNTTDIAMISAELTEAKGWQKPADWPNIQSGALPNSVYLLVGHSADYSTYPTFGINAVVSNSGTYDVYVDGVKQATTNSNTATTLNWQTLALETGFDVTYPTAFRTHIVRITPTDSTNTLTAFKSTATSSSKFGVLWVHFELDNVVNIRSGFAYYPYLEAVTAKDDTIRFDDTVNNNQHGLGYCFNGAGASAPKGILHLPIFKGSNSTAGAYMYYAFNGANVSNCVIRYKDCSVNGTSESSAWVAKEVQTDNARVGLGAIMKGPSITKLPPLSTIDSAMPGPTTNLPNLEPTILDLSGVDYHTRVRIYGTSSVRMNGLKGLVVSSSSPFTGTSPQIDISYTGLNRAALVALFNSLPTVSASQVCKITGATGASDLTASDLAIATGKNWTITR